MCIRDSGKEVKFPAKERRELDKKYKTYFGKDDWKGSVYDFYRDFLLSQKEKEYDCLLYTSVLWADDFGD